MFHNLKKEGQMQTQNLNLFIVDDNRSMVTALKQYLQNKFGFNLNISTFSDGESCLERVTKDTHVVILDHFMEGKKGIDVLKSIKTINPKTEVIMLTSATDINVVKESFKSGAMDYVVKNRTAWNKIAYIINHIVTAPLRILTKEFGISKYLAMFLLTFAAMGIAVGSILHF